MPVYSLGAVAPQLPSEDEYWIAPTASVMGNVILKRNASVWWGATIRGDNDPISFCLSRSAVLTDWEQRFLRSLGQQRYRLTAKQCAVLGGIVSKVHAAGGRG